MPRGPGTTLEPSVIPNLVGNTVRKSKKMLGDIPLKFLEPAPPGPKDDLKIKSQDREPGETVPRPLPSGYFVGVILHGGPTRGDY